MIKEAQIKLTLWYLLIVMIITLSISAFIYRGVSEGTERALDAQRERLEKRLKDFPGGPGWMQREDRPIPLIDEDTLIEVRTGTMKLLIVINLVILLTTGFLGYVFAGITLKPIEIMIRNQKRFISDAAHEMKTPLTIIKTNLEVSARDKNMDIEDARSSMKQTVLEIDKLNHFINRLLNKSKYQNGKNDFHLEGFNLASLVHYTIEEISPIAQEKDIRIDSNLSEVEIIADKNSIKEALINILDNAIKYSNPGGKIDITLKSTNKLGILKIKDNGIGINREDLEHIFEPFYRADKSRKKNNNEGHGLGLSIVKDIIERHKGKIEVQSKIGKGTTIQISLPVKTIS